MYNVNVFKTKEVRKEESIKKLKINGIDYLESLPMTYDKNDVQIKSIEQIAKRYVSNIISIQVAFDIINNHDMEYSTSFFAKLLVKYDVKDSLNDLEKRTFIRQAEENELINLTWQYECLNVLAWVLGLSDDLVFPGQTCDTESLMKYIAPCENLSEFINKCSLRNIEEILDELDLEYRYHWAIVNKRIEPSTNVGNLDGEVVIERRRALEWLFDEENDWNLISLDT